MKTDIYKEKISQSKRKQAEGSRQFLGPRLWAIAGGNEEEGGGASVEGGGDEAQHRPGQPPNDLDQELGEGKKNARYVCCFDSFCYFQLTIKYLSWMRCHGPYQKIKRKYMWIPS